MASLNKVLLIGNLGADPEVRSFQSGDKVANLRLATSKSWKDKSTGEKRESTQWHTIAVFGDGLVGIVERFTKKGSKIYLEGELETRKWQDQQGNDRYSTEVVLRPFAGTLILLDGARQGEGQGGGGRSSGGWGDTSGGNGGFGGGGGQGGARKSDPFGGGDLDDDVPF